MGLGFPGMWDLTLVASMGPERGIGPRGPSGGSSERGGHRWALLLLPAVSGQPCPLGCLSSESGECHSARLGEGSEWSMDRKHIYKSIKRY